MTPTSPADLARRFLELSPQFQLGALPTESRHPQTSTLSTLAKNDLPSAIRLLQRIELDALASALAGRESDVERMSARMRATLERGNRIFFCGCGATGRLSVSIETLWREDFARPRGISSQGLGSADSVASFIAGGDYALVRSIENFEDHPEYGARQLRDLGFRDGDLLIASTEGGETPFVIGATEEATRVSSENPWFLHCNPTDVLCRLVERSRRVIENPRVVSVSFPTGPMALTGSTRLQASTVLMLVAGSALFAARGGAPVRERLEEFEEALSACDLAGLAPLIERESEIYARGEHCLHVSREYAITVLTDTTERTPTFSLLPFENEFDPSGSPAWTYLCVPHARTALEAWQAVLKRAPRALVWPDFAPKYGARVMEGFDFGPHARVRRAQALGAGRQHLFSIDPRESSISLAFDGISVHLERPRSLLAEHLLLKCAMNVSSTLVMGRLGRFTGNLMLFVRATNNKLVDRSIRFTRSLLEDTLLAEGKGRAAPSYEAICFALFECLADLGAEEAVVPKAFELLKKKMGLASSDHGAA